MDRGAWRATVHGVTRVRHDLVTKPSYIFLSNFSFWKAGYSYIHKCLGLFTKDISFQKLIHLEHSNCSSHHPTWASWPFTSRPRSPWPSWPLLCLLSACTVRFSHNTLFWTPPLHQLHCQLQSSFAFIIPGTCTALFPSFLLPQTFIKSWSFSVTLQIFSDPSLISVPLWSALTRTRIYSHLSKFTFMLLLWCSHFSDPDDKLIPLEKYTQNRQFSPFDLSCIRIVFFQSFKNTL